MRFSDPSRFPTVTEVQPWAVMIPCHLGYYTLQVQGRLNEVNSDGIPGNFSLHYLWDADYFCCLVCYHFTSRLEQFYFILSKHQSIKVVSLHQEITKRLTVPLTLSGLTILLPS